MSFTRATALLVLLAGCGGGDEQREPPASPAREPPSTVETPPPQPEPAPAETAEAEAPPAAPWRDCGRILSPVDRRPQRVEARVFDCRAARRVAVRYLRNRSLPEGWGPADCAASRAACEQGGWGFRLVGG